jgi:uncharacterized UPF0146 family protein
MTSYNDYEFVNTQLPRNSQEFLKQRIVEVGITSKIREAANYCKQFCGVTASDLSRVTVEDKIKVEKCLRDNYLSKDPNYFGKRDTIFIDL